MIDYNKCPTCDTWWTKCPCCQESFCDDCGLLESDAEYPEDDEDDA